MSDVVIRTAEAGDAAFLEDMLVQAANALDHLGRDRAETLADPASRTTSQAGHGLPTSA